jgi:two-component system, NtrC family, sensor kinase
VQSPEREREHELLASRIRERLDWFVFTLIIITQVLLVGSVWGQWGRIGILMGTFVTVAVLNFLVSHRFSGEQARVGEALRMVLNLLVAAPIFGHFTDWAFPVWLYLPVNSLWVGGVVDRGARIRLFMMLGVVVVIALLDGCAPLVPFTFLLLSGILSGISEARAELTQLTMNSLAQRNQELARALSELDLVHRRAREQERLSSLGMLAAGIAHEINNPMSFVKSNLHLLQQDLQEQEGLPPHLLEYATEVLPETMEGIKRVCSIVADLRRFARGDPEAWIEYDLNEEVRAALRLTRSRLQAHCDVEVELGELQPMLGHPREISQVVVNLLLNAAQSMTSRGKIHVSTRSDGEDDVVLTVKDMGAGMAPEVLENLFQPFFTTRPEGEGTGMGLAVVHGIVTAHGGRIRVESEPGQGSTFIVRLPRMPPLTFIAARQ